MIFPTNIFWNFNQNNLELEFDELELKFEILELKKEILELFSVLNIQN